MAYSCPVCRTAATTLCYNCKDGTYDQKYLTGEVLVPPAFSTLTPSHRVRRRAYFEPAHQAEAACWAVLANQQARTLRAGSQQAVDTSGQSEGVADVISVPPVRRARAAQVEAWLLRELQALTLEDAPCHAHAVCFPMHLWDHSAARSESYVQVW